MGTEKRSFKPTGLPRQIQKKMQTATGEESLLDEGHDFYLKTGGGKVHGRGWGRHRRELLPP